MKEEKIKVQRLQRKMKDQYKDMQGRLEVVWIFRFWVLEKNELYLIEYVKSSTEIIKNELEDLMQVKEDLIKAKAFKTIYYNNRSNDFPKKKMVNQQIGILYHLHLDRQESLDKLNDSKVAKIIENNSKAIMDLLDNDDENSEVSPIRETTRIQPHDTMVFGKSSNFNDTFDAKVTKSESAMLERNNFLAKAKAKDINKNSLFEYCIEEDDLSYKSSLHSAKYE